MTASEGSTLRTSNFQLRTYRQLHCLRLIRADCDARGGLCELIEQQHIELLAGTAVGYGRDVVFARRQPGRDAEHEPAVACGLPHANAPRLLKPERPIGRED